MHRLGTIGEGNLHKHAKKLSVQDRKLRILVVEDEADLLDALEPYLADEGFDVLRATDGQMAVDQALGERPDLVLLDLNLPKLSGLEAFRQIRRQSNVPVIMLTARGAEVDRVVGLELGADDYIGKPYSSREVVARVKSVLRRSGQAVAPSGVVATPPHEVRRLGDLTVDQTAHEASRAGQTLNLTPTEYRLLDVLTANPGRAFSRDHLIELISDDGGDVFDRTLDRHVANLRRKLEPDPQHPRYILTVFGVGYKMPDFA